MAIPEDSPVKRLKKKKIPNANTHSPNQFVTMKCPWFAGNKKLQPIRLSIKVGVPWRQHEDWPWVISRGGLDLLRTCLAQSIRRDIRTLDGLVDIGIRELERSGEVLTLLYNELDQFMVRWTTKATQDHAPAYMILEALVWWLTFLRTNEILLINQVGSKSTKPNDIDKFRMDFVSRVGKMTLCILGVVLFAYNRSLENGGHFFLTNGAGQNAFLSLVGLLTKWSLEVGKVKSLSQISWGKSSMSWFPRMYPYIAKLCKQEQGPWSALTDVLDFNKRVEFPDAHKPTMAQIFSPGKVKKDEWLWMKSRSCSKADNTVHDLVKDCEQEIEEKYGPWPFDQEERKRFKPMSSLEWVFRHD